jgi:SAM-dependent methyltransferase
MRETAEMGPKDHRANVDEATVAGFGEEWSTFDYSTDDPEVLRGIREAFDLYFEVFPWHSLSPDAEGFDAGCGSGRWARFVAPRVGTLHCVDASPEALDVARRNLRAYTNCELHCASVVEMPFDDESMDFGYSLGVLHHVPDTLEGLRACVRKLKPGAPFLVYLYYALDNRPRFFRAIWRGTDLVRRGIARLPFPARYALSQVIAGTVYFPLARAAKALASAGGDVRNVPLSAYRDQSFYVMRTDALDRFGTRLEQRFTRAQVETMMRAAGLDDIRFVERGAFWTAVGIRGSSSR